MAVCFVFSLALFSGAWALPAGCRGRRGRGPQDTPIVAEDYAVIGISDAKLLVTFLDCFLKHTQ